MLSQQEVADRAGTSLFTIQRIERGEGNVRPKTGRGVAVALGVPIEELLPKAQAPLWSDEKPLRRQTFGYVDARRGLDEYCADWEQRIAEGDLDDRAIEDFMLTALGLLPVMDIAVQSEVSELARASYVPSDEQKRKELLAHSEIRKANRRYLAVFAKVAKALTRKIEEETSEPSSAETNVVRLQEVRDRAMDVQKRATG